MAVPNLTEQDCAELARLLRTVIDGDRFPLSQRVKRWRAILDKLDAPKPKPAPLPPPAPWVNSTIGQRKRRR